jgi:hypothetical protein
MAGRVRAWANLGGLAFAVLAVIGVAMLFDGPTEGSPAKMADWYGSSSNRTQLNIGWALAGLALFFLVWFVGAARERIAAAERADGESTFLATMVTIGGSVFAAVAFCAIGIAGGIKTMSDDTYHHQVYSGVIHAAGDASYIMLVGGGAGMAAMIFAMAAAILSFGLAPRWVGWFGVVAGVAAIFSLFFFTMILWLLWVAVASVAMFVRARSTAGTRTSRAAAVTG